MHNTLWIPVDMWRNPSALRDLAAVGANYRQPSVEVGKSTPIERVDSLATAAYLGMVKARCVSAVALVRGSARRCCQDSSGLQLRQPKTEDRRPKTWVYLCVMTSIDAIRLPIEWTMFGWDTSPRLGGVTFTTGDPGWSWTDAAPDLAITTFDATPGAEVESFVVDHVVLLVPDLADTVGSFSQVGLEPRLRMDVRGRPAAFFRAGPVIEVIESPVRQASIYGIALSTELSLESMSLEWRSRGLSVGEIKPAIQPGRRIMTVHALDAGFALMSSDRSVEEAISHQPSANS